MQAAQVCSSGSYGIGAFHNFFFHKFYFVIYQNVIFKECRVLGPCMYSKALIVSYSLCFFHAGTIAASIINFISLFTVMYTYPPFNLSN